MIDLAVIMSLYKNDCLVNVKQAIESIYAQTYTNFDFYIIFDGPIDLAVEEYIDSLKFNNLFVNKRNINLGLAASLNELLSVVLNKDYLYIARMDADDISLPERFEKQILFFQDNWTVDCLGTWAIEINDTDNEYFRKKMPITHNECFKFFKKRDCMIHPTVMFRKKYFEKAGMYPLDTYFGEDTIMWAQGFANGCVFANIPEYLFKFRLDSNFFDRRRGIKHAKSILKLRLRVNKMLGFGFKEDVFAILYATAKLMPKFILNIIYKIAR